MTAHALLQSVERGLAAIDAQHLRRRRRIAEGKCDVHMQVDGQAMLAFCSNDYLGLAAHPAIAAALQQGASLYGAGSGASHLISGHSRAHALLEERLAEFMAPYLERARALYFCTGYMANLAVVTALAQLNKDDSEIFSESLNHASLIDAARLARTRLNVFAHGAVDELETLLAASSAANKIVVSDSVFSMDGDLADLPALLALCERYGAWLVVDDAHGFGVLGAHGRGVLEHFGLNSPHLVYMGTLGKAAGVGGAFVAAHEQVIEWLIQRARPYIFTTAAAPALAHALLTSLDLIAGDEGARRRRNLHERIAQLRNGLRLADWTLMPSQTAVQPVVIGDNALTMQAAGLLAQQGLWVPGIRPPTVPPGTARLRITLSAAHSAHDVERVIAAVNALQSRLQEAA